MVTEQGIVPQGMGYAFGGSSAGCASTWEILKAISDTRADGTEH